MDFGFVECMPVAASSSIVVFIIVLQILIYIPAHLHKSKTFVCLHPAQMSDYKLMSSRAQHKTSLSRLTLLLSFSWVTWCSFKHSVQVATNQSFVEMFWYIVRSNFHTNRSSFPIFNGQNKSSRVETKREIVQPMKNSFENGYLKINGPQISYLHSLWASRCLRA